MLSPLLTLHPVFSTPLSFLFPVPVLHVLPHTLPSPYITVHLPRFSSVPNCFMYPPYFILCTLLFVCSATSLSSVFSILLTIYYNIAYPLNKLHFPCFTRASPLHFLVFSHRTLFTHCTLHPASSVFLTSAPSAMLSSLVSVLLSANSSSTYRHSFYNLSLHTSHISTMHYPQVSTLFPLYFLSSSFCILYNVCRMLCSLPPPALAILPSILCSHSPCLSLLSFYSVRCALFAVFSFPFPVLITLLLCSFYSVVIMHQSPHLPPILLTP